MTHLEALLELLILVIAAARRPRHRDESPRALLSRPPPSSWQSLFSVTTTRRFNGCSFFCIRTVFFAQNFEHATYVILALA